MTGNEYQELANRTLIDAPDFEITKEQLLLSKLVLGASIMVAEMAEHLKKGIYHQKGVDTDLLSKQTTYAMKALISIDSFLDTPISYEDSIAQQKATDKDVMLIWNSLGLVGETGELVEVIADHACINENKPPLDTEKVMKELGDNQWYAAAIATISNVLLGDAMKHNIEKLKARYPDGYQVERSNFREGIAQ